ncbi:bifunctional UDP-N-acetylmuramoyl-tripeptide:D-alanyl-D-alanine ligase/alanine racemase [Ekhidna sp.]|uniref:bifunctional UDP-N-acetylmuramoyl-tripeptide:D-alanyl-D-alanine ligase/alanine racemase n=1 Tax=Ekhidna sp. TaxID=2608089 RepID=UPI0032968DDD
MLFSHLPNIIKGRLNLNSDIVVSGISTDTRIISGSSNEVFVALKGKRDGHDYAKTAWDKGVRNFILEKELALPNSNILLVDNCLDALQKIGEYHRKHFDIPIIGITGSNGKTTVKEWLSTILAKKFYVVKSPKSYNSQIGVPLSLLEIENMHDIGVFEAGISQKGEMRNLARMISPTFGIFTNIGQAHSHGFSSTREKLQEKLQLFASAGKVLFRKDTQYFELIEEELGNKKISWSLKEDADYNVEWGDETIRVGKLNFNVEFQSKTHLENLTHSIITALEMGLNQEQIQRGIDLIEIVPMRLELKKGINGSYILDDSYNNDEVGLKVALDYLESHKQNENRTLILSDILQSGKPDDELYQHVAKMLREKKINRLIGVGPQISAANANFPDNSLFFINTDNLLKNLPAFQDEMIVVKGARDFELEKVVKRLEKTSHGTVLEVNFESLQHNLSQYQVRIKPETKLMVMVKANAYGSGILEVANFLQHQRVDMLGVAYLDEAIQLRKNGINIPIMIMNPHIESFEQFERYDLQAEVFSLAHLDRLLKDTKHHPKIHLKIDTGMHRLGFSYETINDLIEKLKLNPNVKVEGIFTHFSSADSSIQDDFTTKQAQVFEEVYERLTNALGYQPIKHACNSAGIVRWPQYHFDMVRLGIGLHGFDPTNKLQLRHSSQLKSIVSQIQEVKTGETVGYGRKGKVERASKIAIIPIGYEDGYLRIFGNGNAKMSINRSLCPTIGNICMDMTMLDVTDANVKEGDEVIVFGSEPSIQDLAKWAGTIPYEILTNVSNRVKRIFISE